MAENNIYAQGSRNQYKVRGEDLTIKHIPTGKIVTFPAFLDLFSDSYSSTWNAEDVYGRMDPIATFMNTRRALSVAWWVPADSFEHAEENIGKINQLMSFLYPLYDNGGAGATVINQGPLMRVSFGNLIRNPKTGRGLLGYMNGFTFDPELEYGMFNRRGVLVNDPYLKKKGKDKGSWNPQWNEYYPKSFRINFEMVVLHEHSLGYQKGPGGYVYNDSDLNNGNFPYHTERPEPDGRTTKELSDIIIKNRDPDPPKSRAPRPDPNGPARGFVDNLLGRPRSGRVHWTERK